ncbi:MAG: hypothetical protein K6F75_08270 [Butyrivibrio sp.]|nr:hypothetical protein [Butyrivibrio sp.]
MDFEFTRYEIKNSIGSKINRIWGFAEKHGFPGAVDAFSVGKHHAGKKVLSCAETNTELRDAILSGKGYMAARFGAVELNYLYYYLRSLQGKNDESQREEALRMLCFNAGFFPRKMEIADKVAQIYLDSASNMDLCGVWNIFMEDYVLKHYAKGAKLTKLRYLEPWIAKTEPWSKALSGKKVLFVHPFSESMKLQYDKRKELFKNRFKEEDILPEVDLKLIKAVQSIGGEGAGEFGTWFDAYNFMLDDIRNTDFDVAILGCGAYGFPLAAEIKKMGKVAVHLGGATQLWFGIKGKRWNDDPLIASLYNDSWINPSVEEKPKHAEGVEGGCYW